MEQKNPYINVATGQLVMPEHLRRPLDIHEWRTIKWPPCPNCGGPIEVDNIDVREYSDREAKYIPGMWECTGRGKGSFV